MGSDDDKRDEIARLKALCGDAAELLDSTEQSYRLCTSGTYSDSVRDMVKRLRAAKEE